MKKLKSKKPHSKIKKPIAIITSQFNDEIVDGLFEGAVETLQDHGIAFKDKHRFLVPGAFEIPLVARKLAETRKYSGIITLGCVIKGDTAHFEFISLGATLGLQIAMQETSTPIAFGVLTTYSSAQAIERSQPGPQNKGREAAEALVRTLQTLARI